MNTMKVFALCLCILFPSFHASEVVMGANGVVDIAKTIDLALNGDNAVGS